MFDSLLTASHDSTTCFSPARFCTAFSLRQPARPTRLWNRSASCRPRRIETDCAGALLARAGQGRSDSAKSSSEDERSCGLPDVVPTTRRTCGIDRDWTESGSDVMDQALETVLDPGARSARLTRSNAWRHWCSASCLRGSAICVVKRAPTRLGLRCQNQ